MTLDDSILQALYEEALLLAEEARDVFDARSDADPAGVSGAARIAFSIEGLRTTTRLMHVIAWLLNQRACREGGLSLAELRQQGPLAADRPADPANLAQLDHTVRTLVRESERLHARAARLDAEWRRSGAYTAPAVRSLQGRIARAFAAR